MRSGWTFPLAAAASALTIVLAGAWFAPRGSAAGPSAVASQVNKPQPRVIAPDEGFVGVQRNGIRGQLKVGSVSTGASSLFVGIATFPPGVETVTHLHEIDEEVLYVLSGEVTVTLHEKEYTAGQGGTVFVPPGTWMAIANRTDAPAVVLGVIARGEIEECFRAVFSPDADEAARREGLALCKMRYP